MRTVALVPLIVCAAVGTTFAQRGPDVSAHAKRAPHVVVARIISVVPTFETNSFGDRLIISHADVAVEESLKGQANSVISVDVEGGTVGDVTLRVSDMPSIAPGDRAVFFLHESRPGVHVPHERNESILKLDRSNHVQGTNLSLEEVKRLVREGQGQK
jgi:hypothetical protein